MMKSIIFFVLIMTTAIAYDKKSDNLEGILLCLYKDMNPREILKKEGLDSTETIQNLLYAEKHKKEYFLKALVLDYLYKSNNIEDFYKNAYINADYNNKSMVGIYYAIYLQKMRKNKEAINLLRGISIFASKNKDIPRKIAYAYLLAEDKKDIQNDTKIESYLKIKKVDLEEAGVEINECTK
ncbi:hypothetical protein ACOL3H_06785 [Aliarcobacter butzleri]